MTDWLFYTQLFCIGWIVAMIGLLLYIKQRPESRTAVNLEKFASTDVGERYCKSWVEFADRSFIAVALLITFILVILNASYAIPEPDAGVLRTGFDLVGYTVSPYSIPAYLVLFWWSKPVFSATALLIWKFSEVKTEMGEMT